MYQIKFFYLFKKWIIHMTELIRFKMQTSLKFEKVFPYFKLTYTKKKVLFF